MCDCAARGRLEFRFSRVAGFPRFGDCGDKRDNFQGKRQSVEGRELLRLDVTVPGIFGPDGPLPPEFRETVIQERDEGNRVLQDFLDLFQNRLMRLWMEDAAGMCAELGGEREKGEDLAAVCARALAWADMDVEQFGGGWVEMPERYRTRLGKENAQLGTSAILGKRIGEWTYDFNTRIGKSSLTRIS